MLEQIASDVKKHYYDPTLHGVDWDRKVREMREGIDNADTTVMLSPKLPPYLILSRTSR
jgi:hypothetical protein